MRIYELDEIIKRNEFKQSRSLVNFKMIEILMLKYSDTKYSLVINKIIVVINNHT